VQRECADCEPILAAAPGAAAERAGAAPERA
jgi:hypothetical protein